MQDVPASPRASRLSAPSWLDGRLVLGVLLVLVSVVVGARVLSSADRSQLVWAATKDLTVGSQLQPGDLEPVRVRLFDRSGDYIGATAGAPVGYVLRRGLGTGELLPRRAVTAPTDDVDFRYVAVPVQPGHYPPGLARDQQVDVWVTPGDDGTPGAQPASPAPRGAAAGAALGGAQQVLAGLTVLTGPASGTDLASTGAAVPVVLRVRPTDVGPLVSAMAAGRIDLVRVPRSAEVSGDLAPPAGG